MAATPAPTPVVESPKPIAWFAPTWFAPTWAFARGVVSSGRPAPTARFLEAPRGRAAPYDGTGTTLSVLGLPVSAFAPRPLVGGA